jgi:hypothetical protein
MAHDLRVRLEAIQSSNSQQSKSVEPALRSRAEARGKFPEHSFQELKVET